MTDVTFQALPTDIVQAYRAGATDANGCAAERMTCPAEKYAPCRHCLRYIPKGAEMLVLAHRPFNTAQPYAESGPIFLCADECRRWDNEGAPPVVAESDEDRLVKGYSEDDRIVYGLGKVVAPTDVAARARTVLDDPRVAYVHIRSSTNNCFTCRVDAA
ncbi:MAG: DUF1203 domain-containing protein [Pseudomonadota bacterium]